MSSVALDSDPVEQAHAIVGGFILRCSVMNYRAGQMIAHWFCSDEREKTLSYVTHSIDFKQKRDIVVERVSRFHTAAAEMVSVMEEADRVMQRRDLSVHGLLSGPPEEPFFHQELRGGAFPARRRRTGHTARR